MKKIVTAMVVLVLTISALAGCKGNMDENRPDNNTTAPTAAPTPAPTEAPTQPPMTTPDMDEMIPGEEDQVDPDNGSTTVDPNAGENQDKGRSRKRMRP